MTKGGGPLSSFGIGHLSFSIGHSSFICHSTFVILKRFGSARCCAACRAIEFVVADIESSFETTIVMRIGLGHDTHRLGDGGPLRLGGVDVPHDKQALGHSDADVLLHAITDALLGAAALGDIGQMFPDDSPENRNRDSADMLTLAYQRVLALGYEIGNLDCIVFAQRPKLSPYKEKICARIAEILNIRPDQVGIKAKTGEQVGVVGREEAIMAQCAALLVRRADVGNEPSLPLGL